MHATVSGLHVLCDYSIYNFVYTLHLRMKSWVHGSTGKRGEVDTSTPGLLYVTMMHPLGAD